MKYATVLLSILLSITACKKKESAPATTGSAAPAGSAAPTGSAAAPAEDVSCQDAAKAYTKKMAAKPGNILSDAKPNDGLILYTSVSMEDYCEGEDNLVPWTAAEKACLVKAETTDASSCFSGASLSQVNAGLTEVVTSALENKKKNEAEEAAGSAGSGS